MQTKLISERGWANESTVDRLEEKVNHWLKSHEGKYHILNVSTTSSESKDGGALLVTTILYHELKVPLEKFL